MASSRAGNPERQPAPEGRASHHGTRPHAGGPRPSGARIHAILRVPIALKFSGFIAVLVVAFMAWQSYIAAGIATSGVERETNRGGVILVTALATVLDPACVGDPARRDDLLRSLGEFSMSPGANQVLNVVVEDRGGPIATARGESRFSRSLGNELEDPDASAAGIVIREFTYEGAPVRSYSRPVYARAKAATVETEIIAPEGQTVQASPEPAPAPDSPLGRVEVYVSARGIEESKERLASAMTRVAITSCLVAGLGACLLASLLTAPIRTLVKDMKKVSLGDLDHKSEVSSSDELGDLARAFNSMTTGLKVAQEARIAQRAMEYELSMASAIQARLLPASTPSLPGFDISVHYVPAREVGGDYYDFISIDAERVGVVVADVSGKGVPASLIMTMTRSLIRLAARNEGSPARALELVNRFLTPDMNPGMFVTLAYYVLNPATREVWLARAGHNAPILCSGSGERILRLQPPGIAIGLDRQGGSFAAGLRVQHFRLEPGDVLITYTDGVVEAKNRQGEDYSDQRFAKAIAAAANGTAKEIVDSLLRDIATHQSGSEASDDITLVVLKALPS